MSPAQPAASVGSIAKMRMPMILRLRLLGSGFCVDRRPARSGIDCVAQPDHGAAHVGLPQRATRIWASPFWRKPGCRSAPRRETRLRRQAPARWSRLQGGKALRTWDTDGIAAAGRTGECSARFRSWENTATTRQFHVGWRRSAEYRAFASAVLRLAKYDGVMIAENSGGQGTIGKLLTAQFMHGLHHALEPGRAVDHDHAHAGLGADAMRHTGRNVDARRRPLRETSRRQPGIRRCLRSRSRPGTTWNGSAGGTRSRACIPHGRSRRCRRYRRR